MKLIVGLGNPGKKYQNTRHNIGYVVADRLKLQSSKVSKTGVFMNESGGAVKRLVDRYKVKLDDLYVVHDDLDIALGEYKIQFGKGPKDHKGIKSVDQALGTSDYWRVRVGVENRVEEDRVSGEEYVLGDFTDEEKKIIDSVTREICKKLEMS